MRIEKTDQLPAHILDVDFIKEVVPDILNLKSIASPYRLFRYDKADDRYYFRYINGQPIGYLSMTSFVHKVLPTSPFLIKWMQQHGEDGAAYLRDMKAEYGTTLHVMTTELENGGKGNWDEIRKAAFAAAIDNGYKSEAIEWEAEMTNDIFSYLVFRKDRNVETIAAEFPLCSDEYGLAGCIDRVVRMDFNRQRINAIIDIKSGRKGFWDSHKVQLHGYMKTWNDLFGDVFPVTHCFNFAPAANPITAKTKYKLENQTDAVLSGEKVQVKEYIHELLTMAKSRGMVNPPLSHYELRGDFDLSTFDPESHIVKHQI